MGQIMNLFKIKEKDDDDNDWKSVQIKIGFQDKKFWIRKPSW